MTAPNPRWHSAQVERHVIVMCALDLALDVAFHDGGARDLAVAAEAYTVAGYHDGAIDIAHAGGPAAILAAVGAARRGRHKRALRREAEGMVAAVTLLADAGLLTASALMGARHKRWRERGGHSRAVDAPISHTLDDSATVTA